MLGVHGYVLVDVVRNPAVCRIGNNYLKPPTDINSECGFSYSMVNCSTASHVQMQGLELESVSTFLVVK